jgi:hypothetical protein
LFRRKFQRGNVIVEMVIWRLPKATPDRPHGIKYRFYCGRATTTKPAKAITATTANWKSPTPSPAWTS